MITEFRTHSQWFSVVFFSHNLVVCLRYFFAKKMIDARKKTTNQKMSSESNTYVLCTIRDKKWHHTALHRPK